jgi:hypothetical protein
LFKIEIEFIKMSKKQTIYISYDGTDKIVKYADDLLRNLAKYTVKYRKEKDKLNSKNIDSIITSRLFIAIVNVEYLKSEIAIEEFEHAFDDHRPIFCILSSFFSKLDEKRCLEVFDGKIEIAMRYIELFKNLENFDLPPNSLQKQPWESELMTEICEKIEAFIKFNPLIKDSNLSPNVPPSINIKDLKDKDFKNRDNWKKDLLLLRGTVVINQKEMNNNNNQFAIIGFDRAKSSYRIYLLDSNSSITANFDAEKLKLVKPSLITMNNKSTVLIFDNYNGKIKAFRIVKRSLTSKGSINTNLKDYNDMTVDEDTQDIFLVKCIDNESVIRVIKEDDVEKKVLIYRLPDELVKSDKFKPRFIRVLKNRIFILNACSIRINQETRELIETTFGESFIYVLDKASKEIKFKIDFTKFAFCQPWTLLVDENLNMYTTVSTIDTTQIISNKRYLCKLNRGGDIVEELKEIKTTNLSNDILILDNSFIIINENDILGFSF